MQDISAVARAWEDSPYLFIVKVQPLLRGVEDEDAGAEPLGFSFTSQSRFTSEPGDAASSAHLRPLCSVCSEGGDEGTT